MNQPPANAKPPNNKPANAKPANNKPANARPVNNKPANAKPANAKPANVKPPGNTLIPPSTPAPSTTNKNKNAAAAKAPSMMNRFKSMFGKKNNQASNNNIIPKNLRMAGVTNTNLIAKMRNKGLSNNQIQNLIKNPELRKASSVYTSALNNIRKNSGVNSNNVKTNAYGTSYATYAMLPIAVVGMILFLLFGLTYFIKEGQPDKKK